MCDLHEREPSERWAFFDALLACCTVYHQSTLTLTAIHPDSKHPTPSCHIRLDEPMSLHNALSRLDKANALGWGAYFAVGLRRPGLTRWQRGGTADVVALPALFVDVDDASAKTLERLRCTEPAPSCIVASGGGYHGYWWLNEPTTDLVTARQLLRGLATRLQGDPLSIAQSLRVPFTINSKPARENAPCRVIDLHLRYHRLDDFTALLPVSSRSSQRLPTRAATHDASFTLNPDLIARVAGELIACGCKSRGEWVNGACPFPERHKNGDQHPSFGFNTRTGYGFCHVCGTLLLKVLCAALNIRPSDHGGIRRKEVMSSTPTVVSSPIFIR